MIDHSPKPPEALMRAVAQDMEPVKPAPRPLRLTFRMVPLALLLSSAILLAIGPRQDSVILGPLLTWGAYAVQFLLAIALVWIAAHESTPADRLPKRTVYSAAIGALLVVVAITLSTVSISPSGSTLRDAGGIHIPPQVLETLRVSPWIMDLACGIGSTIAGGILVLLFSWIFRKSLTARPMLAGALYGAGAGVAINAGWRIACPVSTLSHTLGAHGTAIIATIISGALIGRFPGSRGLHIRGKRT